MKHNFGLFLCLFFIFCQGQEKSVSNKNGCIVVSVPSDTLQSQYVGLMKNSNFYKNELADFKNLKDGILFYNWSEGHESGRFLIVDFDKGFKALSKTENFVNEVNFTEQDKKELKLISKKLQKGSYYQNCERINGHANLFILIVRCDNEMKIQYYSPWTHLYEIKTLNVNVKSIQEIFGIIDRNYYKSFKSKKKKKSKL